MASVTKILSPTMLTLIALDQDLLHLDDPISKFLPCPDDRKALTLTHLLTHTIGIGHKNLCQKSYTYETISDYILQIPLDCPIGAEVRYSCPAFILLGRILETVFQAPLDVLFREKIALPLGMTNSSYLPEFGPFVNSNLKPEEAGIVNDYNCRYLGGVAGNAGVFSTLADMKKFVSCLLAHGAPLMRSETFDPATVNRTPNMSESRGLGFLIVNERYSQTGKLFPNGAIGHCGHTGQSVFVDLQSGRYAIILSDMTISTERLFGGERYDDVMRNRAIIHNAILSDLS